jgi:hypothetical protein
MGHFSINTTLTCLRGIKITELNEEDCLWCKRKPSDLVGFMNNT